MHKFLRQELKGFKGLLWIVFFAIGAQYLILRLPRGASETIVAQVNGVGITAQDFHQKARKMQALMERYSGGKFNNLMLDHLLRGVVKESLLVQSAEKNGFFVGKELLSQEVFYMLPQYCFKSDGTLNIETYKQYLQSRGEVISSFEKEQENRIKLSSFQSLVGESSVVPEYISSFEKELRNQKRKYALISIPFKSKEDELNAQDIAEEDLKTYFQSNQESYRLPEARKVRYFSISFDAFKKSLLFSDDELEGYYNKNKARLFTDRPEVSIKQIVFNRTKDGANISIEAKKRASEVLELLKAEPSLFEELARKESDDLSGKNGGLYGVVKKDLLPGAVERAAYRLKNAGDLSSILETKDAFVILQLVSREEKSPKSFSLAKSEIIDMLKKEQVDKRLITQMRSLVRAAKQDLLALDAVVNEYPGEWKEVLLKSSSDEDLDEDLKALKQSVFAKGIKKGSVASSNDKKGATLFQVIDLTPSDLSSFEDVKKRVRADYISVQAEKETKQLAKELHKKVLAGFELSSLGYKITETPLIDGYDLRKDIKKYPGLKKEALLLSDENQVMRSHDQQAYYLIQLVEVKKEDQDSRSKAKKDGSLLLEEERRRITQEAFIAYLEKNATITYNDKVINS